MALAPDRIRAICFDVDGTLSDTDDLWTARLAGLLRPAGRLLPRADTLALARRLIMAAESPGNLAYTLLDWAHLDAPLAQLYAALARRQPARPRSYQLVPGVAALLPALAARYPLAIISANSASNTAAFLEYFHLAALFRCTASGQTCEHTKPFPDPLFWAAAQMQVSPHECLMVGDTTVDIRAGRSAGAQTVGVLCGFGDEKELRAAGADQILPDTAGLGALLGL